MRSIGLGLSVVVAITIGVSDLNSAVLNDFDLSVVCINLDNIGHIALHFAADPGAGQPDRTYARERWFLNLTIQGRELKEQHNVVFYTSEATPETIAKAVMTSIKINGNYGWLRNDRGRIEFRTEDCIKSVQTEVGTVCFSGLVGGKLIAQGQNQVKFCRDTNDGDVQFTVRGFLGVRRAKNKQQTFSVDTVFPE